MKKFIISTFFLSVALTLPANAGSYFSGQKEYLQQCRTCHGRSQTFVGSYTMARWEEILDNDAAILKQMHKKIRVPQKAKETKKLKKYLKSKLFEKKLKYIEKFVTLFAKDGKKSPSATHKK